MSSIASQSKDPLCNDDNRKSDYGTDASSSNNDDEEQDLEKHIKQVWGSSPAYSHHWLRPVADFLVSSTALPQLVMWGFLAWYLLVVAFCWPLLHLKPFLDASVIMILVGLVLNANAFVSFQHSTWSCPANVRDPNLAFYMREQSFSIVRLFVIPYCVSCYSGIVSSTPDFFSIFPTRPSILIPVILGSIVFPLSLRLAAEMTSNVVYPKESKELRASRRSSGVVDINF